MAKYVLAADYTLMTDYRNVPLATFFSCIPTDYWQSRLVFRILADQPKLDAQDEVRLDALASMVASEFWQQDESTQLRLDVVLPEQPCGPVAGDVDTLAIALRNLAENALRY